MNVDRLTAALADRYTIERELGAGGMATVYLAEGLKHRRKVAIKVLRPELAAVIGAERFLAEIRTTANLQHQHILAPIDSGDTDGILWYVMPYIEGESLRERIVREKQLPVGDAVRRAYRPGGETMGNRIVVAVDRAGTERTVIAQPETYTNPRWSPDRRQIAVQKANQSTSQIWIHDLVSATSSQLTHDGSNVRPSWPPDGTRMVFPDIGGERELKWMPIDGSQPAEGVVAGDEINGATATSWSRDGAWIIIDGIVGGATHEAVYAVPTSGKRTMELVVQSEGDARTGAVSPDGTWIAYGVCPPVPCAGRTIPDFHRSGNAAAVGVEPRTDLRGRGFPCAGRPLPRSRRPRPETNFALEH